MVNKLHEIEISSSSSSPSNSILHSQREEEMISRSRIGAIVSLFVSVHPHETSALFYSSSCFFFILSAYFVVLPLRDEGAISLGLANLPGLFVGSLVLTLIAAPVSTLIFSLPNLSKGKVFWCVSCSILHFMAFFFTWIFTFQFEAFVFCVHHSKRGAKVEVNQASPEFSMGSGNHGWFYVSVRIGLFLWVSLLNLITISSTWARVIDVMDSESGSRLFGFIGAGATLGQLFGSLFATGMAWLGPCMCAFSIITCAFSLALFSLFPFCVYFKLLGKKESY
ncbi:hypothetical protein F0562_031505 [Nyssa sinensis]|uniref:ADP,ATP carrier protein n=1 Tax=Nyssa sinensis TaxID=561372 RepID=A0A5J5AUJ7_9ASTE|nr:hypothetical protein F0562_031505 [Nyssa sinensis]